MRIAAVLLTCLLALACPASVSAGTPYLFRYPAVGIDTHWEWWGCDSTGTGSTSTGGDPSAIDVLTDPYLLPPGVLRWGCLTGKNIYLMSHADSVFKAIKAAYHAGALRIGQRVYFSGKSGRVRAFRVKWIRRVSATYLAATFSAWAAKTTSTRMMTLQTCDGRDNQYRIIIRLRPA